MVAFDFEYYKPTTVKEAFQVYKNLSTQGKNARYFCGGTEFITLARKNQMHADAVIDLKAIPECNVCTQQENHFAIGAAVNLNTIAEKNYIPLLSQTVKGIADHTSRNKITLGGNMNSQLIYRESVLPLLVLDSQVKIAGEKVRVEPLRDVFEKQLKLQPGEFITQVVIDSSYQNVPYVSLKKTRRSKVDYPIVSIAAIKKDNHLQIAFSGVCEFPFRLNPIEQLLNDANTTVDQRIEKVIKSLPGNIVDDIQGSAAYREFVFRAALQETLEMLEWAKS